MKDERRLGLIIFCNAIFVLYALCSVLSVHIFILSLFSNLLIFIAPGLGWIGILKNHVKQEVMIIFYIVCFSLIILMAGFILFFLLQITPNPLLFVVYLFFVTNTGILYTRKAKTLSILYKRKSRFVILIVSSFLIYSILFLGMIKVPPLSDLDFEVPGTTYGLIHELKPYLAYNMPEKYFYFAHPPLANFISAYGVFFINKIDSFKFYYDSARAAEDILKSKPGDTLYFSLYMGGSEPEDIQVQNAGRHKFIIKKDNYEELISRDTITEYFFDFDRITFQERNLVADVRIANIFITVLIFASLYLFISQLSHSNLIGILAGLLYVLSPGIYVRACSMGHVATTNYALLIFAYHFIYSDEKRLFTLNRTLFLLLPGMFAVLANQKTLFLVGSVILCNIACFLHEKRKDRKIANIAINTSTVGYMAGLLIFYTYGLLIDKKQFILYHLRVHLFDRIFHLNQMYSNYPSIGRLWAEFQIEFPVFIIALAALVFIFKKLISKKEGIFIYWFLVGAISFSIVDWKQTKHLMLLTPALIVMLTIGIIQLKRIPRRIILLSSICVLAYSIWFDIRLLNHFDLYVPTPGTW